MIGQLVGSAQGRRQHPEIDTVSRERHPMRPRKGGRSYCVRWSWHSCWDRYAKPPEDMNDDSTGLLHGVQEFEVAGELGIRLHYV